MAKRVLKIILVVLLAVAVLLGLLLGFMTWQEYRPAEKEDLKIEEATPAEEVAEGEEAPVLTRTPAPGEELRLVTWNVGYGALGDEADFFMDGGESVLSSEEDVVKDNIDTMGDYLADYNADVVLLQEVDRESKRSYRYDEVAAFKAKLPEYQSTYALNYKAAYVPYPWPPLGRVESGLLTLSKLTVSDANRVRLPCPFTWPVKTVNLKRGLAVHHIPLKLSEEALSATIARGQKPPELTIINLHLEAYDDGEGKVAQTKKLQRLLASERAKGNYVIAGGDFNQTFSNTEYSKYTSDTAPWVPGFIDSHDFDQSWTLLMDSTYPTCRSLHRSYADAEKSDFPYYMIDGFIVSDNIHVRNIATQDLGFVNSDHNPVVLDITLI